MNLFLTDYNLGVIRSKCLLMYLLTTITPLVNTHKYRLLHKGITNDNIVKNSCNNMKYIFIGEDIKNI